MRNPCLPKPRQGEVVFSSSETPRVTHVLVTALGRRVEKVLQSYQGWHNPLVASRLASSGRTSWNQTSTPESP